MTEEELAATGPVQAVLGTITYANLRSGQDPSLTFVNLITAATVAGKMIGLSPREIRVKLREVAGPSDTIYNKILEISDASTPREERPAGSGGRNGPSSEGGSL